MLLLVYWPTLGLLCFSGLPKICAMMLSWVLQQSRGLLRDVVASSNCFLPVGNNDQLNLILLMDCAELSVFESNSDYMTTFF